MNVVLETRDRCGVCGYQRKQFLFPRVRVNKRSLRSLGVSLAAGPDPCPECHHNTGDAPGVRWRLDPDSARRVRAARLRRWPELANEIGDPP